MAHKTLVNGTAYEITGGKTLVDGTAYSIKNGKTLVGGTAYEVGFAKKLLTKLVLSQWGGYNSTDGKASVTIISPEQFAPDPNNPSDVTKSWTVTDADRPNYAIEIPIGSTIECMVSGTSAGIRLNGSEVVGGAGTYSHTVTRGTRINLTGYAGYGFIQIFEDVPEDPVTITLIKDATATWGTFQAKHNGITYDFPATFEANVGDKIDVICRAGDEDEDYIYSFTKQNPGPGAAGYGSYTYPVVYDTKMVASITYEEGYMGEMAVGDISIQRVY